MAKQYIIVFTFYWCVVWMFLAIHFCSLRILWSWNIFCSYSPWYWYLKYIVCVLFLLWDHCFSLSVISIILHKHSADRQSYFFNFLSLVSIISFLLYGLNEWRIEGKKLIEWLSLFSKMQSICISKVKKLPWN